jgi:hypothetical protein
MYIQVPNSPWLGKQVRVVREGPDEGRAGEVRAVHRVRDSDPAEYALNVLEDLGTSKVGGIFSVRHPRVEEERPESESVRGEKIDWRVCNAQMRTRLAAELAIDDIEDIVMNNTLELGTVHAILAELEVRVQPENTLLVPPSVALACYEGVPEDHGGEVATFLVSLAEHQHIYVVLQSEGPSHYTLLHIERMEGHEVRIEFRDSLKSNPATARAAATRFLRGANFIKAPAEAPEAINETHQTDGWSCGLWATRWIERSLREHRGERRQPPPRIRLVCDRTNEFIGKLRVAGDLAKAKGKILKADEPKHDSFEHALAAGHACTKCIQTKAGTKGCRACMGDWFEEIRLKHWGFKVDH